MIWVPTILSPLSLRLLQRPLRRLSQLLFCRSKFLCYPSQVKSTGDVIGNVDVDYTTGSFYPSYSIQPPTAGGLRYAGVGGAMCSYYHAYGGNKELEALWFSVHFPFDFSAI